MREQDRRILQTEDRTQPSVSDSAMYFPRPFSLERSPMGPVDSTRFICTYDGKPLSQYLPKILSRLTALDSCTWVTDQVNYHPDTKVNATWPPLRILGGPGSLSEAFFSLPFYLKTFFHWGTGTYEAIQVEFQAVFQHQPTINANLPPPVFPVPLARPLAPSPKPVSLIGIFFLSLVAVVCSSCFLISKNHEPIHLLP